MVHLNCIVYNAPGRMAQRETEKRVDADTRGTELTKAIVQCFGDGERNDQAISEFEEWEWEAIAAESGVRKEVIGGRGPSGVDKKLNKRVWAQTRGSDRGMAVCGGNMGSAWRRSNGVKVYTIGQRNGHFREISHEEV